MPDELSDGVLLGSETAKNGFRNEDDVVVRFNNWQHDQTTQQWLLVMGYRVSDIEWVQATKIPGSHKADVQVQVTIKLTAVVGIENLQVKLVSQSTGFNQIDKRWVKSYAELWNIPDNVQRLLQRFTGELPPVTNTRDPRRTFADEFCASDQQTLLHFLIDHQTLIVSDILKGRGKFSAEWFLVILKGSGAERWALKPINYVLNYFGNGPVTITARGSLRIGLITMQRKGGDAGRPTANMLQFKINPVLLIG
ncbi:MAG: hypothetical protein R3C01_02005 [Planctomycetaceae bacterium]